MLGHSVQLPIPDGAADQFAVLCWDGSKWVEITQKTGEENVSKLVDADTANTLYWIESADDNFYRVLATERTGIFILVKK